MGPLVMMAGLMVLQIQPSIAWCCVYTCVYCCTRGANHCVGQGVEITACKAEVGSYVYKPWLKAFSVSVIKTLSCSRVHYTCFKKWWTCYTFALGEFFIDFSCLINQFFPRLMHKAIPFKLLFHVFFSVVPLSTTIQKSKIKTKSRSQK